MFENPRIGRQARNFTTNVPKILVLKSSSEQIFSRKLPLGAPVRLLFTYKNSCGGAISVAERSVAASSRVIFRIGVHTIPAPRKAILHRVNIAPKFSSRQSGSSDRSASHQRCFHMIASYCRS